MRYTVILLCFSTLLFAHAGLSFPGLQTSSFDGGELPGTFNWSSIEPSPKLRYHQCYDDFECARLLVPLDWTNISNPNEVALAMIRYPAQVPKTDNSFGGSILLNPGGPSGSGVNVNRWWAPQIQEIVDGDLKFEILSWDPRGVHYTTPSVSCFEKDRARASLVERGAAVGTMDDSTTGFNTKWAQAEGLGKLCGSTKLGVYPDGSNIRRYISTALVAHDMVAIIDAVEEEKEQNISQDLSYNRHQTVMQGSDPKSKEPALLNYWGWSYGTYLGNTFASMFPSRIGRMILDGVVDAPDYAATGWTSNLQDNALLWDYFFQFCYDAGQKCALYDPSHRSVDDLQTQVRNFLDSLREKPLALVTNGEITLLNRYDVLQQMHLAGYGPYQKWPDLATKLAALIRKDADTLSNLRLDSPMETFSLFNPFLNRSEMLPNSYPHGLEASAAILCGDGDAFPPPSKAEFSEYLDLLLNQSSIIAPIWAEITVKCRFWPDKLRPAKPNRFTGPFTSKLSDYDSRASPILFIGNTADPVTPVRNAVAMSKYHEGASLLIQDSPGHCTGPHIPSRCVWDSVKAFFNHGALPKNGTVCPVDWKPWDRYVG